jgi:N-acetylneuraminate synthase
MNTDPHVYFIAEAGVNHGGNRELAFAMIDGAADAGADAVKFQTFDADVLASAESGKADYQKNDGDCGESQRDMLKRLELPRAWHTGLKRHAEARGIDFLSTAFDLGSLEFLVNLGLPRLKVPSGEIGNAPLLWKFGNSGLPLVISTGMATLSDVERALAVVAHARNNAYEPRSMNDALEAWRNRNLHASLKGNVTLLHCTSSYPATPESVNLRAMLTMKQAFGLEVGYSDHTRGIAVAIAAAAMGARLIEKHFTLDPSLPGPDQQASLDLSELTELIRGIREVELATGDGIKVPHKIEDDVAKVARQKVVAARDIPAGTCLARDDLTTQRAGSGMEPHQLWELIGRRTRTDLTAGTPVEPGTLAT